jgi:hypothetical protein
VDRPTVDRPTDAGLADRARGVLDRNRRGDWTCPALHFYPHQWLWDSCFVAIGLARHDAPRAAGELRAIFRGQWANGMLPHMIFAPDVPDVGSRRIWQSKRYDDAPRDVDTSCITQPPLAAIATWRVARSLAEPERRAFLTESFPKLVRYHEWMYRERDLDARGLVTLIHPWECGLDTTPPWTRLLRRMRGPWWLDVALKLRLSRVARMFRRDTRYLPATTRLSDDDGLRMLALVHRARRHGFELRRMPPDESVLVEDLAFNSLLAAANQSLVAIADELRTPLDGALLRRFESTRTAFSSLWHEKTGQYYSRNRVTDELVRLPTVATFLPLAAELPDPDRTARLLELLRDESRFWPRYPVPSVPIDSKHFDAHRYWRGPTWVNTNWLIIESLRTAGADETATELVRRTLDLVDRSGFAEYFSALDGEGFGAPEFSWTAALVLDLLEPSPAPAS